MVQSVLEMSGNSSEQSFYSKRRVSEADRKAYGRSRVRTHRALSWTYRLAAVGLLAGSAVSGYQTFNYKNDEIDRLHEIRRGEATESYGPGVPEVRVEFTSAHRWELREAYVTKAGLFLLTLGGLAGAGAGFSRGQDRANKASAYRGGESSRFSVYEDSDGRQYHVWDGGPGRS